MRIPSGKTDVYIYFVAFFGGARVKGLSSFTVYRSRNGAAPVLYTTPTTTELSAANAPGVYGLLIDEDTTIASGSDSEEMVLHITKTGMDPVTRTIELYRRDTTSGTTSTNQTGDAYARLGAPAGASIAADLVTIDDFLDTEVAAIKAKTDQLTFTVANTLNVAVTHWVATAVATVDTAGYPVVTVKDGTGVGELNTAGGRVSSDVTRWLGSAVATPTVAGVPMVEVVSADAAGKTDIRSAVGLASANLDTQLDALPTNAELATALGTADDAVLAQVALVKAKTDSLTFTVAGHADVNLQYVNDVQVNGTGAAGNEWGP